MTAALEMQRTRPTRIKVAGIQTYPLTWVPAGHARALPLRPSRQRTPGIQTYPPGGTSPSTRPSTECRPSEAASPGFWTPFPAPFPTTSRHPRGRTLQHCKYPSNLVSGYENAASLVFLPCFSPADSQNALSQSEGRDVLEENKRVLPPILSRGVALPSQIQQTGSNGVKRIHTRPLLAEKSQPGEDTQSSCQTGLYRGCLPQTRGLSPGCMASTIFRHRWRAPGGKTQWGGPREGNASPRNR